jgi:hypothetical protein
MFDVNKALAHARADVTVRLIKMKYTEKGNLSCVLSKYACAETEKWRKLRVHGVALDR